MYGFLGLQFLFGYHRLPQTRHYWCSDIDLCVPIVREVMTRERYKQILSNLHVNDNLSIPLDNKDRLYKIRPLITTINENFKKFRLPDQFQSIDESMVKFKGRSSLKQYNPMKPVKRGYKLWCRADMSGYIYEFIIYQGKTHDDRKKKQFGLGGSVVAKLSSSLHHGNFVIIMDNYFTSLELFEYLKSQGVYACGTIRSNRAGLPKLAIDKDLKRGEYDFRISDQGIAYFKWKDNRSVHLLSNYHGTEVVNVKRTQKDGTKLDVPAPLAIKDYNTHMEGVDKADMLRSLYDRNRRSKKWWHRLLFAIIEMALVNAYIIFTDMNEKVPFLQFKRQVSQGLLTKGKKASSNRGRPKRKSLDQTTDPLSKRKKLAFSVSNDIRLQNQGGHWPEFVPNRGRCEYCATKHIESRPHSRCTLCKVFLCVNQKKNCFLDFHQS
ncbi:piggyBac transposable element-derived protein 3-like [Centruroides vittatus]|uniref:piggyBac transposable element-derived protein 3-like n=1 Tax=Centruroides vittatus TaxID=120091 RepID=UPI00350EF0A9